MKWLSLRWVKWSGAAALGLLLAAIISIPFIMPAVAAYGCPTCYGLEKAAADLYVERGIKAEDRKGLGALLNAAKAKVEAFYGSVESFPTILVCQNQ